MPGNDGLGLPCAKCGGYVLTVIRQKRGNRKNVRWRLCEGCKHINRTWEVAAPDGNALPADFAKQAE